MLVYDRKSGIVLGGQAAGYKGADKRLDVIATATAAKLTVSDLADSSVNLVCRPWVESKNYWGVYFDVIEKGKLELEKRGITIPFPQRDVHIYEEKKQ